MKLRFATTASILALGLASSAAMADQTGMSGQTAVEREGQQVTGEIQRVAEPGDVIYLDTGHEFHVRDAPLIELQPGATVRVTFEEAPGDVLIATEIELVGDADVEAQPGTQPDVQAQPGTRTQPGTQPQPGAETPAAAATRDAPGEVTGQIQRLDEAGDMLYLDTGHTFEVSHDPVMGLQQGETVRVTYEEGPGGVLIATNVEVVSDVDVDVDVEAQPGAQPDVQAQPGTQAQPGAETPAAAATPDAPGQVTGRIQRFDESGDMLYLDTGHMFESSHDPVMGLQEGEAVRVTYEEGPGGVLIATDVEVISDVELGVDVDIEEGTAD